QTPASITTKILAIFKLYYTIARCILQSFALQNPYFLQRRAEPLVGFYALFIQDGPQARGKARSIGATDDKDQDRPQFARPAWRRIGELFDRVKLAMHAMYGAETFFALEAQQAFEPQKIHPRQLVNSTHRPAESGVGDLTQNGQGKHLDGAVKKPSRRGS